MLAESDRRVLTAGPADALVSRYALNHLRALDRARQTLRLCFVSVCSEPWTERRKCCGSAWPLFALGRVDHSTKPRRATRITILEVLYCS